MSNGEEAERRSSIPVELALGVPTIDLSSQKFKYSRYLKCSDYLIFSSRRLTRVVTKIIKMTVETPRARRRMAEKARPRHHQHQGSASDDTPLPRRRPSDARVPPPPLVVSHQVRSSSRRREDGEGSQPATTGGPVGRTRDALLGARNRGSDPRRVGEVAARLTTAPHSGSASNAV